MIRYFLLAIILFVSLYSQAQTTETIVSSRPGQAFAPQVTGTSIFQVQSGFTIGGSDFGITSPVDNNLFIHNTLLRYGFSEKLEVRASVTTQSVRTTGPLINSKDLDGVSEITYGVRYVILNGNNSAGKISLQSDIGLPFRTGDYSENDNFTFQVLLIQTYNVFTENLLLNINLGYLSSADGENIEGKYVINFSHPLGEKFSTFIEHYGFYRDRKVEGFFDAGFAYLVYNDIQFDLSAGYGRNGRGEAETTFWFADAGISFRLK